MPMNEYKDLGFLLFEFHYMLCFFPLVTVINVEMLYNYIYTYEISEERAPNTPSTCDRTHAYEQSLIISKLLLTASSIDIASLTSKNNSLTSSE